ncbi:hypothetical protein BFJ66_g17978 [Fusarium oxysporum f. sp. cepae]|nr:hypothetical protein BFJ66_g17978 [Fusarium oxysporum f. sp. cepae]
MNQVNVAAAGIGLQLQAVSDRKAEMSSSHHNRQIRFIGVEVNHDCKTNWGSTGCGPAHVNTSMIIS